MSSFTDIRKIAWDHGKIGHPARRVWVPDPTSENPLKGHGFSWETWRIAYERVCPDCQVRPGTTVIFADAQTATCNEDGTWHVMEKGIPRSAPRLYMSDEEFKKLAVKSEDK